MQAAGGALTAKQAPHRPGTAPALDQANTTYQRRFPRGEKT
jgi:hypothetical protein